MKTYSATLLATISTLALSVPATALAQDATAQSANSETASTGDIIVTAQKRSERLNDVPLSITAATGEQLARAGVHNPADLEKVVPGFTYQPSTYGTPVFTIRGIGFFDVSVAVAPAVSVYIDQVPVPYLAMTAGASLDVERVEALKGPQGTLFGQNSTGGAINYIAAKPTDTFKAGADLGYGRFNAIEAQGFISGPLSDTVRARASLRTEQRGNWQRSVSRNDGLGKRDFTTGRILLDWEPSDALLFELNANGWIDKSDTVAAQYVEYAPTSSNYTDLRDALLADVPAPNNNRAADWDPNTRLKRNDRFHQLSLRGDLELTNKITLTSISAYSHLRNRAPTDTDGVDENNFLLTVDAEINAFSQELRLAGESGPIHWMVGANYGHDSTKDDQAGHYTASNSGVGPFRYNDFINSSHQKITNKAVFASLDYKITDTITLQGSARYNDERRRFRGCLFDGGDGALSDAFSFLSNLFTGGSVALPPGACVTLGDGVTGTDNVPVPIVTKRLNEDNVSWRASLNWKPNLNSLLYANVTRGYKAGSFPTVPGLKPAEFNAATQESVLAYEVGFKLTVPEQRLQLTGAGFYYKYSDKQILGYITTGFGNLPGLVNIPKSSVRGFEVGLNWRPVEGLTLNGGATYVKSRVDRTFLTNDPLAAVVDIKGEAFPSTPKWQLSSDAEYEFPISANIDGFLGGNVRYRSKAVTAFGDLPEFRLPGYALVDLRAGIASPDERWRVQVWGRNVFNKFYLIHVSHVVDTVARTTGMPATYGITFSYRY